MRVCNMLQSLDRQLTFGYLPVVFVVESNMINTQNRTCRLRLFLNTK